RLYGRNGDRKGEMKGIQRAHPRRRRVIALVTIPYCTSTADHHGKRSLMLCFLLRSTSNVS
ncbi:MAG: hypothetical protein KZQ66_12960, partial [Candidatus Thiodiazotropha sp. (ex Lucinoma aequizonata)]|nr:hypothetical protein [Candidatus Thiodiazotropha sp. (ex Lucinoma aequizonata)]MCU7900371.1 hypothetical protein [Candidatus Thiodiazotropha sp. (ex Lucinoma aequizonata)]MCU7902792.1 hypothetical protein [Candidatus Thiodiazotropha sp. (ex Lucinoma aequizonata)]MCU7909385.1 hypothetical protein [Candidatus Thiodiazotropha sp. (ex Lucinoma aequizonata)]MCU7912737.1 hypothetical protein [Candidatus Thiodiazotropha sp. (ex Lucinoma aequizonata)]